MKLHQFLRQTSPFTIICCIGKRENNKRLSQRETAPWTTWNAIEMKSTSSREALWNHNISSIGNLGRRYNNQGLDILWTIEYELFRMMYILVLQHALSSFAEKAIKIFRSFHRQRIIKKVVLHAVRAGNDPTFCQTSLY